MAPTEDMETDAGPTLPPQDTDEALVEQELGTTQALGVTCKRSALLQEAFDKALAYGLRDPSRENFGDNFPDLDESLIDALYDTYKQTLTLVRSHCQAEFQQVCTEHRVHELLQDLDSAGGDQPSTSVAPSPLALLSRERSTAVVATGVDSKGASAGVVGHAEAAARLHALRQEATYLQDMLERARATEARLVEALALRQGTIDKMTTTYNRVVSDVKQVYDITRVWPKAPQLGGKPA